MAPFERRGRVPALLAAAGVVAVACGGGSSSDDPSPDASLDAAWGGEGGTAARGGRGGGGVPTAGGGGVRGGRGAAPDGGLVSDATAASDAASRIDATRGLRDASADATVTEDAGVDAGWDAAVAGSVRFVDVTLAAGINHTQGTDFTCGSPLATGECGVEVAAFTGGAAAGDFDGDGWIDLYVTRYDGTDLLYRNRGDGTFENVATASGLTAVIASNGVGFCDVDNDGDQDVYVTSVGDVRHYLFVNDGAGGFTEEAVPRGATLLPVELHLGTSVAFGDYDLDGWPDAYVGEWRLTSMFPGPPPLANARLLRNRGGLEPGYFDDVTSAAGVQLDSGSNTAVFAFSAAFSDMDDDGHPDLVISGDFGESRLFWNDGDGTFTDGTVSAGVGTDENGMGCAIGDYDGDGRLDWLVTSVFDPARTCETATCNWGYSGNRLYRNLGGRVFEDRTGAAGVRDGAWGWGVTFFDYDNDGDLDLIETNGLDFRAAVVDDPFTATPMRLWRNEGGRFIEAARFAGLTDTDDGKGLLVLDFDADGDLDVFAVNNGEPPRLYRNEGGNANHWLRVRLQGTVSTRDALGTKTWLSRFVGATPTLRERRGGSNYLGQNEPVIHYGLGASSEPIAELVVQWPSGRRQRLTNVAVDQTLDLVEPTGDP